MKIIKDIRLYRSQTENTDGSNPGGFFNKPAHIITRRIIMKLRERGFSLGNFDHLYINFTTVLPENCTMPAKRKVDKVFPWFRYYDVGVSEDFYNRLENNDCIDKIIELVKDVLLHFATDDRIKTMIEESVSEAVEKGENMLMKFKEKKSATNHAVIYLRALDDGYFFPLLCVTDNDRNTVLIKNLEKTHCLDQFGEIQLSSKRVKINPRKNSIALAQNLQPLVFEL